MRIISNLLIVLSVSLVVLLNGCGGGGDSSSGGPSSTGANYAGVPAHDLFDTSTSATNYPLTTAAIAKINSGALTENTDVTTANFAAFLPPNISYTPGADATTRMMRPAPAIVPEDGTNPATTTLLSGINTISARIARGTSGTVLPFWADFYVPAGMVAQDFRVLSLSGGITATSGPGIPGFCINDNMGNLKYSYMSSYTLYATTYASTQSPTALSVVRLGPLTRNGILRPYRVFCSGGDGAGVQLQCKLVSGTDTGNLVLGSGAFQVTLTWDTDQTDIDLHVIEPDGDHVYYGNKNSATGQLDHDEQYGFGPENYYVLSTAVPETGQYQIYIHYYTSHASGSVPPTNCLVRIKTQASNQVYTVRLDSKGQAKNVAHVTFDAGHHATIDAGVLGTTRTPSRALPVK